MSQYESLLFKRQSNSYFHIHPEVPLEIPSESLDKFDTDSFNAMWENRRRLNNMTLKERWEEHYKKEKEKYGKCTHTTADNVKHEYFLDVILSDSNNTNNNNIDSSTCYKYNFWLNS